MADIVLLDRFFHQVHKHLVNCYQEIDRWPVILGIFGRPGDGKSAQLLTALTQCNVEPVRLNAADLESGLAGEPGRHIARTYATASMAVEKSVPAALVVDDIDTTVGEWEMNTGTVNHQQVLAELMHLADRPVDSSRNFPRRVPVFVTGNNLARLYPPLRRHGRMNTFAWRPEPYEVQAVVRGIFAGLADEATLDLLASKYASEPLAFFAQIRIELLDVEAAKLLPRTGYDMRHLLKHGGGRGANRPIRSIAPRELFDTAQRVQAERQASAQNFLG
jgi:hypothetical protein